MNSIASLSFLEERACRLSQHPRLGHLSKTIPTLADGYDYNPNTYESIVQQHQQLRKPCVVRNCFEAATNYMEHRGLTQWLERERVVQPKQRFEPMLWIDVEDRVTQLHYDNFDNQMFVVSGTKVFLLFPPEDHGHLYHPFGTLGRDRLSPVNPEDPDLTMFPRYPKAKPTLVVLQAGDMLYVPADWPYWVYTIGSHEERAIAMNYWYPASLREIWRRPSSQITYSMWTSFANLYVRCKRAWLGKRSAVPEPTDVLYVHSNQNKEVAERYGQNLAEYLDVLNQPSAK